MTVPHQRSFGGLGAPGFAIEHAARTHQTFKFGFVLGAELPQRTPGRSHRDAEQRQRRMGDAHVALRAHELAKRENPVEQLPRFGDFLLFDREIKELHAAVDPVETLFVVDSMTGQDAANTAKAFHDALPLTGVILTKTDGDARGGAALSIRQITGKPIKFMGIGEKLDALEPW